MENRILKSCLYENAVVVLWFHSPKCLKGFQRMPKFLILNCLQTTKLCKSAPVTYFCVYLCFRYCMTFCYSCSPPGKKVALRDGGKTRRWVKKSNFIIDCVQRFQFLTLLLFSCWENFFFLVTVRTKLFLFRIF